MNELICYAFLLLVRIVGSGVWFGLRREMGLWERGARIVVLGVLLNLLPALVLSAFGVWRPVVDVGVWLLICLLLGGHALLRDGSCMRSFAVWRAAFGVSGVLLVALLLPVRAEWLVGGWDPGVYQTTAVEIARNHGTQSFERDVYLRLTPEERRMFSRAEKGYREILPGVPISIEDGKLHHYFFPLTPIWGAWLYRLGGLSLLVRAGGIAAFLGLWPLAALLFRLGGGRLVAAGLVFLFVSPMWWYHQGIPTSELLQMLLFLGGGLLYLDVRGRDASMWPLFGLAFGLAVNRFSDPPLIGIVLLFVAIGEAWSEGRTGFLRQWGAITAGLLAGMLWIGAFYPLTLFRLEAKDSAVTIVAIVFGIISGVVLLAYFFLSRRWAEGLRKCLLWGSVGAGLLTLAVAVPAMEMRIMRLLESVPWLFWGVHRYTRLVAYHGLAFWLLAVIGLLVVFHRGRQANSGRNVAILFVVACLATTALLILHPGIAPFYPWALRRYLVFLLPLLALCQGMAILWAIWGWEKDWRIIAGKLLVLGISIGAFVQGAEISRDAIRAGDYVGMVDFLRRMDLVLDSSDIVVADDARWATPLLLVSGLDVFNGSLIWKHPDMAVRQAMTESIVRVGRETGRRVVWVTSTSGGLDLYGEGLASRLVEEVAAPIPFSYQTVIHSAGAKVYLNRSMEQTYRFWGFGDSVLEKYLH